MKPITVAQAQAYDQYTIETIGIPSLVLMERAALKVFEAAETFQPQKTLVLAGGGNNGGDALAAARLLHCAGYAVDIFLLGNRAHLSADCKRQLAICEHYQIPQAAKATAAYDLFIDGIFGRGLDRAISGRYRTAIDQAADAKVPTLAIDIPSGINGDTGDIMGTALPAEMTVTLAYAKAGLLKASGPKYCGKLVIADIGIYAEKDAEKNDH
ncbi:NAD(P)H-hydrate epimerase [Enterococcus hirae]|nr:NAD(P)H-hydrate epimerase [Enterococcus hirae]